MNESEFRDWCRASLSQLDDRMKKVEARPIGQPRRPSDLELKGDIAELVQSLAQGVREGRVTALGIAYLGDDGKGYSGYAASEHFALIGAVQSLGLRILNELLKANEEDRALTGGGET